MGSTSTYGLPYPANSDAPTGPTQLQALAEGVEAELVRIDGAVLDLENPNRFGATLSCQHSFSSSGVVVNVGSAAPGWVERDDNGGYGTAGATLNPVTIPVGQSGLYAVSVRVDFNASATGRAFVETKYGGTMVPTGQQANDRYSLGSGEDYGSGGVVVPLQAGQTVSVDCLLTAVAGSKIADVVLSVYKVGP